MHLLSPRRCASTIADAFADLGGGGPYHFPSFCSVGCHRETYSTFCLSKCKRFAGPQQYVFHGRVVFVPEIGGGDSEGGTCGEEKAGNTTGVKSGSVMNRLDRAARHFLPMVRTHLWTQKRTLMQGLLRSAGLESNDRIETSVRALLPPLIWPRTNNVFFYDGLVGVVVDAVPRARGKYTKMDGVKGQLRHPCSARYSRSPSYRTAE